MNKDDIKENPEPIIPQLEIKKYGYLERDPNKELTYYERVMLMFDNKTPQHLQTPWSLKTLWGKTKSVISTTLAVVLTPIIFVASLPLVLIGVGICSLGLFVVLLFSCFYEFSTYLSQKFSNFADNFV
jgi:hypothetical protein